MNPLEASIRLAAQTNDELFNLFSRTGSKTTDGYVVAAYNAARLALVEALKIGNIVDRRKAINDITNTLYTAVISKTGDLLRETQAKGRANADEHLLFYQNDTPDTFDKANAVDVYNGALTSIYTKLNAQTMFIQTIVAADLDPALVLGDEQHVGALKYNDIVSTTSFWVATLFWDAFNDRVLSSSKNYRYEKQVVATMDNRVTDCCLQAHGQTRPFNEKFKLTGSPRFADELEWTPFHWYCRSSIALYLAEFDDGLTERMINSAQTIMQERENGIFINRHPADAFI